MTGILAGDWRPALPAGTGSAPDRQLGAGRAPATDSSSRACNDRVVHRVGVLDGDHVLTLKRPDRTLGGARSAADCSGGATRTSSPRGSRTPTATGSSWSIGPLAIPTVSPKLPG